MTQDQQDLQDQRAIQVIPDRLALLDRLVQLALLGLKVTLVTLGLKVLPERLDRLAILVRLGLLVLLGHKVHKATRAIKATPEIQGQQVQQDLLDQLDPKAQQDQLARQVQPELPEPQVQQAHRE